MVKALRTSVRTGGLRQGGLQAGLGSDSVFATSSLDLNFAVNKNLGTLVDATTGSNLVNFTRATSATYVGSDGLIKSATTDEARFDHDPTTGESLGLLLEDEGRNLLQYSEDFTDPDWIVINLNGTLTPDQAVAPDGTITAELYTEDTATSERYFAQTSPVTSGTTYTVSIWAKQASGDRYLGLVLPSAGFGVNCIASFTLSGAGSYNITTSGTGTTADIQQFPNGWYRCWLTSQATATVSPAAQFRLSSSSTNGTQSYTGDGTSGIYVWGAQFEAGSSPTSYIPTENNPLGVTRAADVASIGGSDFSSWYRQDEGTVFVDVFNRAIYSGTNSFPYIAQFDDGTNTERISLDHSVLAGGYRTQYVVRDGDINQASITAQSGLATGAAKWASTYGLNSFASASNGAAAVAGGSGTVPTVNRLQIGTGFGTQYNGTIKRLTFWPQRLPNATLQNITT